MQGREIDFKDGKKRTLQFGVRAAGMVEHEFGDQPFSVLIGTGAGFRFVSYSIWAGLQKFHPGTSYEQVCDLMDTYLAEAGRSYLDFISPIVDALVDAGILTRIGEPTDPNAEKEPVKH
jgi:hypothetical protein